MKNPKKYSDLVSHLHSGFEFDIFMDEVERIYSHCENDLEEGSGWITNTMSMNLTRKLRNIGSKIRTERNTGKKIDMISEQLSYLVGVVLISVLVSGDSKGLLNKSSKLLGLIKSMGRS
tara:strand:+ start:132 stop:488 length:357 start_codon:yes stop_codon:yes gene_type:complete